MGEALGPTDGAFVGRIGPSDGEIDGRLVGDTTPSVGPDVGDADGCSSCMGLLTVMVTVACAVSPTVFVTS